MTPTAEQVQEHRDEHYDEIVMDCPICVAEWEELGR